MLSGTRCTLSSYAFARALLLVLLTPSMVRLVLRIPGVLALAVADPAPRILREKKILAVRALTDVECRCPCFFDDRDDVAEAEKRERRQDERPCERPLRRDDATGAIRVAQRIVIG